MAVDREFVYIKNDEPLFFMPLLLPLSLSPSLPSSLPPSHEQGRRREGKARIPQGLWNFSHSRSHQRQKFRMWEHVGFHPRWNQSAQWEWSSSVQWEQAKVASKRTPPIHQTSHSGFRGCIYIQVPQPHLHQGESPGCTKVSIFIKIPFKK